VDNLLPIAIGVGAAIAFFVGTLLKAFPWVFA
jgi:hypothetical protein